MNKGKAIPSVVIVTAIAIALLWGINLKKDSKMPISESQSFMKIYNNLDEIEEDSEIIVQVKALEGSEQEIYLNDLGEPGIGYTYTPVKILKIYKDHFGLKDTEELKVMEFSCIMENPDGSKYMQTGQGYRPMKVGNEYLLFLHYTKLKDMFYPTGQYQGKYAIDRILSSDTITDLTNEELEIGDYASINIYKKVAEEVKKRYIS